MSIALTEFHLQELDEKGYVIIPDYYTGNQLKEMQAAQRRVLPTWQEIKENPPNSRAIYKDFPSDEIVLLQGIVDHHAWDFSRRWFETEHIHYRAGCMVARYPGFQGGGIGNDDAGLHIDNDNNSLLPPSNNLRTFGQLWFWVHLEDVDEDQAPLRLLAKEHGRDMTKCEPLVCRGGTLCMFTNYTLHSATDYLRTEGQRFTHYTDKGNHPVFRQFIGTLAAKDREIFRFPPAGHPYYTPQTLKALAKQYPGWNVNEYS